MERIHHQLDMGRIHHQLIGSSRSQFNSHLRYFAQMLPKILQNFMAYLTIQLIRQQHKEKKPEGDHRSTKKGGGRDPGQVWLWPQIQRFFFVDEGLPVITTLAWKMCGKKIYTISALFTGFGICKNTCTSFGGLGSHRPVCLKKAQQLEVFCLRPFETWTLEYQKSIFF